MISRLRGFNGTEFEAVKTVDSEGDPIDYVANNFNDKITFALTEMSVGKNIIRVREKFRPDMLQYTGVLCRI